MNNQERFFILSSFNRLNIPLSKKVYQFVDFKITQGWNPPLGSLDEVDRLILEEYINFNKFD